MLGSLGVRSHSHNCIASVFQEIMSSCPCLSLFFLTYVSFLSLAQCVPQCISGFLTPCLVIFQPVAKRKSTFCLCRAYCLPCLSMSVSSLRLRMFFIGYCSVITCSRSVDLCFMTMCAQDTDRQSKMNLSWLSKHSGASLIASAAPVHICFLLYQFLMRLQSVSLFSSFCNSIYSIVLWSLHGLAFLQSRSDHLTHQ